MKAIREALKRIERAAGEFRQALAKDISMRERDRYLNILRGNMRDVERWAKDVPVLKEFDVETESNGDD